MNVRKAIILGVTMLILLTIILWIGCERKRKEPKLSKINFSEAIELEELDDVQLIISYFGSYSSNPSLIFHREKMVENANEGYPTTVVDSTRLKEHIDLLKQLDNMELVAIEEELQEIDVQLSYVFINTKNNKTFIVASEIDTSRIRVNGVEVKEDIILYDVIMPFLPKDVARKLQEILEQRY